MQNGLVLTSVQVPPTAIRLVIIERTVLPAFHTRPFQPRFVREMYMNLAFGQLQINALHPPWLSNSQNLGIQVSVLHLPIIRTNPLESPNAPGKS